jgi:alpha-glucosidase
VDDSWWRTAVIYQVYPRSFADSDGDGVGDLPGITSRLSSLAALGVDAVWLSPFFRSPQVDAGYDVSDYCDVDPVFGTLPDLDALLARAHDLGLKVIVDLVPNHTSDQHPWFRAALRDGPGSPARARYHFADEPTDWQSVFGGPAWSRVPDGQSYLHLYDPAQPDLNWANSEVRAEFERILRFWLDRGVDGFRVDVAHGLVKDPTYPSYGGSPLGLLAKRGAPYWDQDEVHDIYRSWRAVLDGYTAADPSQPRILCGEANVAIDRAIRYVRPDELHQTFNFPYLQTPFEPVALRQVIDESLTAYGSVGAPATWVLSNHDVVRHATRYGYPVDAQPRMGVGADDPQPDAALGLRRARAAILLMLALPGSAYLYQGEELGLPEHTTMPDDARQDPNWERSGHTERGRDGCRVPLPWVAGVDGLGFTDGVPWLPQPDSFDAYARNRQEERPDSTLRLYVGALAFRRSLSLATGEVHWLSAPSSAVLDFVTAGIRVTVNLGPTAVPLPDDADVLLASEPLETWTVEPDTAVWCRQGDAAQA